MKLYISESYFTFRNRCYRTIRGIDIGNPLSGLSSNIFVKRIEERIEHLRILSKFSTRYVDDVVAIRKRKELESILSKLSTNHKNITFTKADEHNHQTSFLDLLTNNN